MEGKKKANLFWKSAIIIAPTTRLGSEINAIPLIFWSWKNVVLASCQFNEGPTWRIVKRNYFWRRIYQQIILYVYLSSAEITYRLLNEQI